MLTIVAIATSVELQILWCFLQCRFCLGYAMGRENKSASIAAMLLTEGLSEYLHVQSDLLETQAPPKPSHKCLLVEDFWSPTNLLIAMGLVVLAKLGGSNTLSQRRCLLQASRLAWTFPYTFKGSALKQLQWTWVESRYICTYVCTYIHNMYTLMYTCVYMYVYDIYV